MIRGILNKTINFLIPPLCSLCKAPVNQPHKLCAACWAQLSFIQDPMCPHCGYPFEFDIDGNQTCQSCFKSEPVAHRMRSVLIYRGLAKKIIMGFKHGDRTDLLIVIADWMLQHYLKNPELRADVIIPVPLHARRLIKRRYNQTALIGKKLGDKIGIPVSLDSLKRTKATLPQKGKKIERYHNVQGAFSVSQKDLAILRGKTILLIDDVITTGATIDACAETLLKAGVVRVNVLSLARVVL